MTEYTRLELWRDLIKTTPTLELEEVLAGRKAENFLHRLVGQHLKYKGASCYVGKRVPSTKFKRRFEVDLIILTKKQIHFVEVKNWSGQLIERNGQWVQMKRNGEEREHPNLTQYNAQKTEAMIEYLQGCGVDIPKSFISQKVLFMNRNLEIDPVIEADNNVIPYRKLSHYLHHQKGASLSERMIHSLVEVCVNTEKSKIILDGLFSAMDKKTVKQANIALSQLSTWDLIGYYGTRVVQGDILELYIDGKKQAIETLKSNDVIELNWVRSKVRGLLRAMLNQKPFGVTRLGKRKLPLHPVNDYIKFHCAGDPKPTEIALKQLSNITKG